MVTQITTDIELEETTNLNISLPRVFADMFVVLFLIMF